MIPIPINDHIRRRIFWTVTLALIAANTFVFVYELSLGPQLNRLVFAFAVIPARYSTPHALVRTGPAVLILTIFTSMFLHGGWLHLIGNMLFLFVFGRSIEDRYGHGKFLVIYFLGGFIAALTHIYFNAGSRIPTLGASGAIAAVLGAYFVCYPAARITTFIPIIVFFWKVEIPAVFVLGYWFLIQIAAANVESLDIETATHGGTAYWAHIGGFIAGIALALILRPRRLKESSRLTDTGY